MARLSVISAALMVVSVLGASSPREIAVAYGAANTKLVGLRYLQENVTEDNDTLVVEPTPPPTTAPTTPAPTTATPTTPTPAPSTPAPTTPAPTSATPAPTTPAPPPATCSQCRAGCIIAGVCALEGNISYTEASCRDVGTFCPPVVEFALQFVANDPAAVLQQDTTFMDIMAGTGSEVLFGIPDKKDRIVVTLTDVVSGGRRLRSLQSNSTNAIRADYSATLTEAEAATISQTMESDPVAALALFDAAFSNTSFGFVVDQSSVEALIGSIQTGVAAMESETAGRLALPTPPPTSRQQVDDGDETSGVKSTFSVSSILLLLAVGLTA